MTLLLPPGFVKFGTRGDVADIIHVHNSGAFSAQVCLSGLALESDVGQHNALELLQKRAMRIIFNHDDCLTSLSYHPASRPVANNSPNSFSCVTFSKKLNLCTTSCLLGVTWTPWIDSAIQKTSELSQTGTERFRRLSIPYSVSSSATFRSRLKTELFSAAYY